MTTPIQCCTACRDILDEFVDVMTTCVGLMEMAKIGDQSLHDSRALHQAKRLLAQVKGLHWKEDGGTHVL